MTAVSRKKKSYQVLLTTADADVGTSPELFRVGTVFATVAEVHVDPLVFAAAIAFSRP